MTTTFSGIYQIEIILVVLTDLNKERFVSFSSVYVNFWFELYLQLHTRTGASYLLTTIIKSAIK